MKARVILAMCVVFLLGVVSSANGQLVAGSPEDKAYTKIADENNPDTKLALIQDFEKQFPQSKVLPDIYLMMMEVYRGKNDNVKVIEVGEKVIKLDAENVSALMAVARNLSLERKQLDKAVQYAQKAVDTVAKWKTQQAPPQYTDEQWKEYVESMDQAAKSILGYAKSIRP